MKWISKFDIVVKYFFMTPSILATPRKEDTASQLLLLGWKLVKLSEKLQSMRFRSARVE